MRVIARALDRRSAGIEADIEKTPSRESQSRFLGGYSLYAHLVGLFFGYPVGRILPITETFSVACFTTT